MSCDSLADAECYDGDERERDEDDCGKDRVVHEVVHDKDRFAFVDHSCVCHDHATNPTIKQPSAEREAE